jgi:hypothetical protein
MSSGTSAFRTTSLILVLITILMFMIKPSVFFGSGGEVKGFGGQVTDKETPFPLGVFLYSSTVVIYLLISYIESL